MLGWLRRPVRAVRYAATDSRIPRPLRWLAALALLPVPGPFDEIVLLLAAIPLGLFHRQPLADAWRRSYVAGSPTGQATPVPPSPQ